MTNSVEINNHPEKKNPLTGILWGHYLQAFTECIDNALICTKIENIKNLPSSDAVKNYTDNQMVLRTNLIDSYKAALTARLNFDQSAYDSAYKRINTALETYSQTDSFNPNYIDEVMTRADFGLRGINPQWKFGSPRLTDLDQLTEPSLARTEPSLARKSLTVYDSKSHIDLGDGIDLTGIDLTRKPINARKAAETQPQKR